MTSMRTAVLTVSTSVSRREAEDESGPVGFNFDWSFDSYPMAYERPGPTMIVYRLREDQCA